MNRTTTVTLPDGTTATRTSKTRVYTWAVMQRVDNYGMFADRATRVAKLEATLARIEEIVASGDLTQFTRKVTSWNGKGEKFYSSFLPGDENGEYPGYTLPDYTRPHWGEYVTVSLDSIRRQIARFSKEMAELSAGPDYTYHIVQWCSREDLADKASRAKEFNYATYVSCSPVPCTEA